MKNIAILVYDLTIEYNIVVVDGIINYLKKKDDVNVFISALNAPHAVKFQYDYQYWSGINLVKSDSIDAAIVVTNSFFHDISCQGLAKELECLLPKPIISVSNPLDLPTNRYTCISCADAYVKIVGHLLEKHGRKKIAFMSAALTHSPESDEREAAFRAAMEKHGLKVDENLMFEGDFTPRSAYDCLKTKYKKKEDLDFDALVCANDYMAAGSVSAFEEFGISVPSDVCVIGFDDAEVAINCRPTLSTISQSVAMTGAKAAELVYDILCGKEVPQRVEIQSVPFYRQSCGCIGLKERTKGYLNSEGALIEQSGVAMTELGLFNNGLNDLTTLTHILSMTDSVTSMREFFTTIVNNLKILHFEMLAMCVYDEAIDVSPDDTFVMPDKIKLVFLIDDARQISENYYEEGGIEFNPYKELLPEQMDSLKHGNYYLLPIFLQNFNYGYLVCRLPTNKYPIYSVFLKILVNAFVHSFIYSKQEKERALLAEKNQDLNFQSKTDELTKLFNRRGFYEYGQQLLDVAVASGQIGCVFFCDLDGLKTINDTYGHEIGDLAIKTEAKVLRAAFRDSDMVGRLSGDEFGIVAPCLPERKVDLIRERFKSLNEEFSKEAKLPFTLSISIGPVEFDAEHTDLKDLLKEADKKLYEEKKIKHAQRDAKK